MRDRVTPTVMRTRPRTTTRHRGHFHRSRRSAQGGRAVASSAVIRRSVSTELRELFQDFANGLTDVRPDADKVLTDDHAPVEWMTDKMIFDEAARRTG